MMMLQYGCLYNIGAHFLRKSTGFDLHDFNYHVMIKEKMRSAALLFAGKD